MNKTRSLSSWGYVLLGQGRQKIKYIMFEGSKCKKNKRGSESREHWAKAFNLRQEGQGRSY